MAGVHDRPVRFAALFCRHGYLSQRVLHRRSQSRYGVGRDVPRHFPHHIQDHRCHHQRHHGVHHRPHAHQTGQGAAVAAFIGAPFNGDGHPSVRCAEREHDAADHLGHALVQSLLFGRAHHLQHEPQPSRSALDAQHRAAKRARRVQQHRDHHDERYPRGARVPDAHHTFARNEQGPLDHLHEHPLVHHAAPCLP